MFAIDESIQAIVSSGLANNSSKHKTQLRDQSQFGLKRAASCVTPMARNQHLDDIRRVTKADKGTTCVLVGSVYCVLAVVSVSLALLTKKIQSNTTKIRNIG